MIMAQCTFRVFIFRIIGSSNFERMMSSDPVTNEDEELRFKWSFLQVDVALKHEMLI